jgi:hypothetical protein
VVKSRGLEKELTKVKGSLKKESDEHDNPRVAVRLICNDLEMTASEETSSLAVSSLRITD